MLSTGAFNALLKIMEEPPPYVKFILATTEIHKVPATILSRCQRYDFRRIKPQDIAERLKFIASQEELQLTDSGAAMIAKLADGGMRDAVSLLDRCSVCGSEINEETVSNAAGIAGNEHLFSILEAVSDGDTAKALSVTASLYDMSKDMSRLCEELISQLRNIMLLKVSPQTAENLIVCSADDMEKLKALAEKAELETIMSRISVLQECSEHMNRAANKRVEFEMSLIKLCGNLNKIAETIDNSEIYDKIKQLEDKMRSAPVQVQKEPKKEILTAQSPVEPVPNVDVNKLELKDIPILDRWNDVIEALKIDCPDIAGSLNDSYAQSIGNIIFITSKDRFFITIFKNHNNSKRLGDTIQRVLGQRYAVRARCSTTLDEQKSMAEKLIQKAIDNSIATAVEK